MPAILGHIPYPGRTIPHHQGLLCPTQATPQGFPMQPLSKVHRFPLPTDHYLVGEHPPTAGGLPRLLLPIIHAGPQFVPFHTLFLRRVLPPARSPLAHLPTVQHQHRQRRRPPLRFAFYGRVLHPLLRSFLGPSPKSLGQRMQRRILHDDSPFLRHCCSFRIRTRGRDRKGQFVFQRQT